jgi:hypothetical protein
MSGTLIVAPLAHGAAPTAPGTGAGNLLTRDPKEAWIADGMGEKRINVDMGGVISIDAFFLGFTNATADAQWTIYSATGPGVGLVARHSGAFRAADSIGPSHHGFVRLAAPVASRYFTIAVTQGGADPLYAGIVLLGLAFEKHREFGGGRTIIDTGTRQDLPSGGFGDGEGAIKAQFSWSFIDLTAAELRALWAIKVGRGTRAPLLVVEDADLTQGRNEAIHYGVFDRFQSYESVEADTNRWAGSVVEWL